MPQSLLAILALMIASLFSVSQQRNIIGNYENMIRSELEIMASGVALQVMEDIAGHPFDAATAAADFEFDEFSLNDLALAPFAYDSTYSTAAYLEHFNGTTTTVDFATSEGTVTFDISVDVHYIDDSKSETNNRTDAKEVVVNVSHPRYTTDLVSLSRSFSP